MGAARCPRPVLESAAIDSMLSLRQCALLVLLLVLCSQHSAASGVNYAEIRSRVAHAFEEKAYEMSQLLGSLQDASKESQALLAAIDAQCR